MRARRFLKRKRPRNWMKPKVRDLLFYFRTVDDLSEDHLPAIRARLEDLPTRPGVYLMQNAKGEVIYIGKAVNLRSRVRSYFNKTVSTNHLASHLLRQTAADIEWIVTENEVEALILEANLVHKHRPRYNIQLKDDKHYPYIKVTWSETFPRLEVTRQVVKGKDAYFGPYTNVRAMRKTLKLLHRIFRIRECDLKLPQEKLARPCLYYDIKRCDGPCASLIGAEEYRKLVEEAMLLLKGKHKDLRKRLEENMRLAAAEERFEAAARIRDQVQSLNAIMEEQRVDLGDEDTAKDLVAVARIGRIGCVVVLEVRDGFVSGRKSFEVDCPLEQDETQLITDFLKSYYNEADAIPREILLSHPTLLDENLEALLRALRGGAMSLEIPQRGEKHRQMRMAEENARMLVSEFVAKRERRVRQNYMVTALQEDLQLQKPPNRIEGFDISHLSGTDTVASQVVFVDGKPFKKDYRHYNIKTVKGIDDFASMREVIHRRIGRLVEENQPLPDLILIDGGKGQLGMAYEVLREFGKEDQPIIGLAKRLEEIFFPGESEPLLIPKTSASLKLLQQVRDEAHRFAITFQRSKRVKYLSESWLDEVPGIGEKTKMKLLRTFKSPLDIKAKTEDELRIVVGQALARRIRAFAEASEAEVSTAAAGGAGATGTEDGGRGRAEPESSESRSEERPSGNLPPGLSSGRQAAGNGARPSTGEPVPSEAEVQASLHSTPG